MIYCVVLCSCELVVGVFWKFVVGLVCFRLFWLSWCSLWRFVGVCAGSALVVYMGPVLLLLCWLLIVGVVEAGLVGRLCLAAVLLLLC